MKIVDANRDASHSQFFKPIYNFVYKMLFSLGISMPAIVLSFDPETKRAVVQPGLRSLFRNNRRGLMSASRPPIADVPVIFPSAAGFVLYFPIQEGDIVQLHWNHRGLENFKKSWRESDPDDVLNSKDVIAYAGWGGQTITPQAQSDVSLQKEDGSAAMRIAPDGRVTVDTPSPVDIISGGVVTIDPSNVARVVGDLVVDGDVRVGGKATVASTISAGGNIIGAGVSLGGHSHGGVRTGGGSTGPPN